MGRPIERQHGPWHVTIGVHPNDHPWFKWFKPWVACMEVDRGEGPSLFAHVHRSCFTLKQAEKHQFLLNKLIDALTPETAEEFFEHIYEQSEPA